VGGDTNAVDNAAQDANADMERARSVLVVGLRAAVQADNCASAYELLHSVAPLLFPLAPAPPQEDVDEGLQDADLVSPPLKLWQPTTVMRKESDFRAFLHNLASKAKSPKLLMTIGAAIVLDEFASGRMHQHILDACKQLESWLENSTSFVYRMKSWLDLNEHHVPSESPSFTSFLTNHAIENRTRFYDGLRELEESKGTQQTMRQLCALVSQLHHPCFRLQLLQHILGLDERYDLDAVMGVAALAFNVISTVQQGGADAASKGSPEAVLEVCARRVRGYDFEALPGIDARILAGG